MRSPLHLPTQKPVRGSPDSAIDYRSKLLASVEKRQIYDKRHRVPFGEYVPLARLLPFVGRLARNAGDFSAGHEVSLFDWQGATIGTSICFEVTFPNEVAEFTRSGAS